MYLLWSSLLSCGLLIHAAPPSDPCALPSLNEVGSQYLLFGQDCRQYAYGYNAGSSAKVELMDANGTVVGAYQYLDANNVTQRVNYTANDVDGFVVDASNLPTPVQDTPEVAQAKAEHAAAVAAEEAASTEPTTTEASTEDTPSTEVPDATWFRDSVVRVPHDEQILFKPVLSVWYPASSYVQSLPAESPASASQKPQPKKQYVWNGKRF